MPNQARWAVFGPGNIANRFASQLPHSQHGVLSAVASSDPERAKAFAEKYGAQTWGTYEEILANPDVDAVYISTVHTTHANLAIEALNAGKHVLCEKPLAPNVGATMAMIDAAQRNNRVLLEAYMYRFHPMIADTLDLVASGGLGEILNIDATFSFRAGSRSGRLFDPDTAGGGILDVGGYPMSFIQSVVRATGASATPTSFSAGGSLTEAGVDEWAVASASFGSINALARTGTRVNQPFGARIDGSKGTAILHDPWLFGDARLEIHHVDSDPETRTYDQGNSYALEADAVITAANDGRTEVDTLTWAQSLELAQALQQWRYALGERYPFEQDTANIAPLVDLSARYEPLIPKAPIDGVGEFSRLVMGCDNQGNLAHASAIFDAFITSGGTTFDTAYIYGGGLHEKMVGQWQANRGIRSEIELVVKGAHTPHNNPQAVGNQLTESLERLQTDYADLYFLHRDNPEIPVGEFVTALNEEIRAGRIKAFGGSNWTIPRIEEANAWASANGMQGFSALSNHFGLAHALDVPWAGCEHVTDPEDRQWLADNQFPLLPWSSQARGFFTGRAHPDNTSDAELVRCYYSSENFERLRRVNEFAAERTVPSTAIALAYVLAQPFPSFALIGPRTITEMRSSLVALQVNLTDDEVAWLDLRTDTKP